MSEQLLTKEEAKNRLLMVKRRDKARALRKDAKELRDQADTIDRMADAIIERLGTWDEVK